MSRLLLPLLLLAVVAESIFAQPKTIRVPQDQPTVQAGINAAVNGDTVLVAEGTYSVNLVLKKKIVLGSLYIIDKDTSHISKTILDGGSPAKSDSASVIHITAGTDSTTVIKGFTIQNGRGLRWYDGSIARYWRGGGGINIFGGGAKITNNVITNDTLISTDGVYGGGIAILPNDAPLSSWVIEDNLIKKNILFCSSSTVVDGEGAGVFLTGNGRFARNTVDSNSVGGIVAGIGGGIEAFGTPGQGPSNIQFFGNRVRWNTATHRGGGTVLLGSPSLGAPLNTMFANNLVAGNTASNTGGGFFVDRGCVVSFVNNTVADNTAGHGAGFWINGTETDHSQVIGINNIFWNKGTYLNEIYGADWESFHHNLIRGESSRGVQNFSADPQFVPDGSYRLSATSPCIGAGTSSFNVLGTILNAPATDLLGGVRPRSGGSAPDMGAIEEDLSTSSAQRPNRAEVHSFVHKSLKRWHIVFPPLGREGELNRPVLIHLHGYGNPVDWEMNYLQVHLHGDTAGYITVYPEAVEWHWNSTVSEVLPALVTPNVDDISYISALIDTLRGQYSIDTTKVYVTGYSNGGFMAHRLAANLSGRLTAVAVVDGAITPTILSEYSAKRPVPILIMHGTADAVVPYAAGPPWYTVEQTVGFWNTWNKATVRADSTVINGNGTDGSSVLRVRYYAGPLGDSLRVVFYKVLGGGHEWPGSPPYFGSSTINRDIDATAEAIRFFQNPTVGVERENEASVPTAYGISQNYPNPFNPSTAIRYVLPQRSHVTLTVYNMLGQRVADLVSAEKEAGSYEVMFNANDLSSGVYLYRIQAGSFVQTKKLLLVK